jgi:hypothetical protein
MKFNNLFKAIRVIEVTKATLTVTENEEGYTYVIIPNRPENQPTLFVACSHTLTDSQYRGFIHQFGSEWAEYDEDGVVINGTYEHNCKFVTLNAVAPELQKQMSNIPATATLGEIQELAKAIVVEAVKYGATHFFCTGEPTLTMWANIYASGEFEQGLDLGYLAFQLGIQKPNEFKGSESFAMKCIQSTTERKGVEVTNADGSVTKTQIFSHVMWREMF